MYLSHGPDLQSQLVHNSNEELKEGEGEITILLHNMTDFSTVQIVHAPITLILTCLFSEEDQCVTALACEAFTGSLRFPQTNVCFMDSTGSHDSHTHFVTLSSFSLFNGWSYWTNAEVAKPICSTLWKFLFRDQCLQRKKELKVLQ